MGRLFWKFFLSILLAQVAATVGIGSAFWLHDQSRRRTEATEVDTGMQAKFLLDAADMTLKHGGVPALRELVQNMRLHTVYLIAPDGTDLLGRTVPAELRAQASAQLNAGASAGHAAVRSLPTPDGQRLLAFVPRFDARSGMSGLGPLLSPMPERRERSEPGGPGGPFSAGIRPPGGSVLGGPPGGPMMFGYRVGRVVPMIGATLASLLFAVLLAWYFSRPIRALRSAFYAASKGDLAPRFDQAGGSDEFRDLGRDFDRMTEQLRNLIDGQRRLLHDVSHELRSPLARLQAAIGLAHQQPDKLASSLDRIERESVRMDKLVGELLTLSRLEATQRIEHREPIDVGEMVGQIADDARFESSNSGAAIVVAAMDGITVNGDPDLLWRAVENVVRNAIKHGAGVVEIGVTRAGGLVSIAVCDRGPGVHPDDLASLFQPFFRCQQVDGAPNGIDGHGLGLAIARRVIDAHDGAIAVENRAGGGLAVTLSLPVAG
jgi:two-component system OmpR family sensor kinase